MIAIRFETGDGTYVEDRWYHAHAFLRPYRMAFGGQWYEQNATDGDVWVYRAQHAERGSMPDDAAIQPSGYVPPTGKSNA